MTNEEKRYKSALAEMACLICERIYGQHSGGDVQLHHLRTGGWGKSGYKTLIPLCFNHHTGPEGIHSLGTRAWERRFDVSQKDLLTEVQDRMAFRGY